MGSAKCSAESSRSGALFGNALAIEIALKEMSMVPAFSATASTVRRLRPLRKSLAPSRANARATAPPMSPPAPYITAILSLSIMSVLLRVVVGSTVHMAMTTRGSKDHRPAAGKAPVASFLHDRPCERRVLSDTFRAASALDHAALLQDAGLAPGCGRDRPGDPASSMAAARRGKVDQRDAGLALQDRDECMPRPLAEGASSSSAAAPGRPIAEHGDTTRSSGGRAALGRAGARHAARRGRRRWPAAG